MAERSTRSGRLASTPQSVAPLLGQLSADIVERAACGETQERATGSVPDVENAGAIVASSLTLTRSPA